ncbi:hypothetical protein IFR05_007982 [Cadophora sp. M221]|nr:hypothetical protein IFR05_007982 [Cadophora sp. M221]
MSALPVPAELDAIQDGFRHALAAGSVPLDEEIDARELLSEYLLKRYNQLSNPRDLNDAIEHTEAVLRRLPPGSPKLAENYDTLSFLKVSEYGITKALKDLDSAVEMSLTAKQEALKMALLETDPDKYFQIVNNLGYAQSQRHAESKVPQDLEHAIACGREIIRLAPKSSSQYTMAVANLASRLRVRYSVQHNIADHDEALRLISEQPGAPIPGKYSRETQAVNLFQLAELSYQKYEKDGKLETLDEAIRQGTAALAELPDQHEKRPDVLRRVSQMHAFRYDKTTDLADGKNAVLYAKMRFQCLPPTHPATGTHLWQYLMYAVYVTNASPHLADVTESINETVKFMTMMPEKYDRRETCQWLLGDLFSRQYTLSGRLEDLIEVVEQNRKVCLEHNERASREGSGDVAVEKVYVLKRSLMKIAKAPADNQIRVLITGKLQGYFKSACDLSGVANAPIALYNARWRELAMYAEVLESNQSATINDIEAKIKEMELANLAKDDTAKKNRERPWRPKEYHTELGVRSLAIDPRNKNIIFEMPALVQDIFGYEDTKPLSMFQFASREQKLERESRQKEAAEGKNPNPSLCRICRKLKILKYSESGFVWNEKVKYIPFGNFNQLYSRRPCSVCHLILSLISGPGHSGLHPTLASIDPEVQGTSIEPVKLDSGAEVLQVRYGLREVGALRIVDRNNLHQSLRQGFQIEGGVSPEDVFKNKTGPTIRKDQTVSIPRIQRWLNNCQHNHGRQCNGEVSSPLKVPMMFIDVIDDCLVHADSSVKYFALSYVWGQNVKMSETLQENYQARVKKGGLSSALGTSLPRTIQDAISLVKSLDGRYLWVDALCIVQDDSVNKQGEINKMDTIYSQAFATIVAVGGLDANSGIPGIRPDSRLPQDVQSITISNGSPNLEYISASKSNEQIHLVTTPMSLSLMLETSKWESRAWTFQERLLSKRCIYFSKDWAYFQCNREISNEVDVDVSIQGPPSRTLENPLNELKLLKNMKEEQVFRGVHSAYMKLAEKYSVRELSFHADVLNAFSGVFSVLGGHLQGNTLFGLPAAFIDLALLWTPARKLKRREDVIKAPGLTGDPSQTVQSTCPTWSWAGYIGPVEYHIFTGDQTIPLPTPMVETFQIYRRGWLFSAHSYGKSTYQALDPSSNIRFDGKVGWAENIQETYTELRKSLKISALGPEVLQFEAWTVPIQSFRSATEIELLSNQENVHTSGQQGVYRLYDRNDKHCGLVFGLPTAKSSVDDKNPTLLVAISRNEETGRSYKGPSRVEGEIPMFNRDVYPSAGPGSGMVNALVVSWAGSDVGERVTVARIHAKAWEEAGAVENHVNLG